MFRKIRFPSPDPGEVGIAARRWDFGDGTSSAESSPTHSYAQEGSYVVTLTVTTMDGRTASITQSLEVRKRPARAPRLGL